MAIVVTESLETRRFSSQGGRVSASRRFDVYDDANPALLPADILALFGTATTPTAMPATGDLFPGATGVYAQDFSMELAEGGQMPGQWRVEWEYANAEPGETQPGEVGYAQFDIRYFAEFDDFWRQVSSFPTDGNPAGTADEAGGTAIDSAGIPASLLRLKQELTVVEVVERTTFATRSVAIRAAIGRRNTAPFYGAQIGTLVYTGAQSSDIEPGKMRISHTWQYDNAYHLVQYPVRNQDGEPVLELVSGLFRAQDVRWIQPFPGGYDFNALSENF